jgi:hypothetical protein
MSIQGISKEIYAIANLVLDVGKKLLNILKTLRIVKNVWKVVVDFIEDLNAIIPRSNVRHFYLLI